MRGLFSKRTKDQVHNEAGEQEGEIHHKAPRARALRAGVAEFLVKAPINAEHRSTEDHRQVHRENDTEEFDRQIAKLKRLQPRLFKNED